MEIFPHKDMCKLLDFSLNRLAAKVLKITYNAQPSNNFEFTFQLLAIGLLSTAAFHL